MKKFILFTLIFSSISLSCILVKGQDKEFNNFYFNNFLTFHSLENFTKSNEIFIYDENKKMGGIESNYEYKTDSGIQKIHILNSIPNTKNYLLLSDYIINKNLAVISFATSSRKEYIIYTLKRKNENEKWWDIISIYKGSMN
ncbi:hypothetical protein ACKW6Q_09265 [Chryseobacterium kwangjuense]|uniref:Lipoprotein n=1 Tax=Chryseobacterium kwangjuense TaxID=267125 RepID=A0ABW9K3B2_9FLAO